MSNIDELYFKSATDLKDYITENQKTKEVLLSNLYMLGSELGGEGTGALLGKCFILGCWEKSITPILVFDGCTVDKDLLLGMRKIVCPYILNFTKSFRPAIYFMNADTNTRKLAIHTFDSVCNIKFVANGMRDTNNATKRHIPRLSISSI